MDEIVIDGNFHLHLGQETDQSLGAVELFGVTALPAAAANVGDGHQIDFPLTERCLDGSDLFRADDGMIYFI